MVVPKRVILSGGVVHFTEQKLVTLMTSTTVLLLDRSQLSIPAKDILIFVFVLLVILLVQRKALITTL